MCLLVNEHGIAGGFGMCEIPGRSWFSTWGLEFFSLSLQIPKKTISIVFLTIPYILCDIFLSGY